MYKKVILDNGVRVVLERMSSLRSIAIGIWANVGSRNEATSESGYSHFIEHMMFKGTKRRTAAQISNEIDALGGEMNAFTTHEATAFYVKVLDQHVGHALDLLADLFHESRFSTAEIQKEKQVILEEIRMVKDDPEDLVHELHGKDVLGTHPLGRPILGEPETMTTLKRRDLLRYLQNQYHPEKTVVSIAGNFKVEELLPQLNKYFGGWTRTQASPTSKVLDPWPDNGSMKARVYRKKLEQVHLCMGFKGLPVGHPDRYTANVLNTILGGGVSSRLFQQLREKRGLAYTIYSHLSGFSDGGLLTVYAATRSEEVENVVRVVCKEIQKLCRRGVTEVELQRTKTQLKGNLMLGLEGTYGRMNKLAKNELYQGRYVSLQEMIREIDQISIDDLRQLNRQLLDINGLVVTALGPVAKKVTLNGVH
ncbi:M16 family metallopeptidase [Candidatus Nitrospira salsa]|nr:MAG: peptidase M16 [Nitrospirales bacterium]